MAATSYTFDARLWLYAGKGAWHFVTVPADIGKAIRFHHPAQRGFVPLPVEAQLGNTRWKTSLFPDSRSGSFLLAIKASVRKAEKLANGDAVSVTLTLAAGATVT